MKYLVFSDLHGDYEACKRIIDEFNLNDCDKLICLGDLLYHGPRNDLPSGHNPKKVIELLKPYNDKLIWAQGNCDAEVDEMVMEINYKRFININLNNKAFVLTHGHHLSKHKPDNNLSKGTVVMYGHYHVFDRTVIDGVTYLNIGSTSIPKDGKKQYAIIDETNITVYDFNNQIIFQENLLNL